MKKGDIVLVSFTGKDMLNNKVFDTTDEKTAKENGLFRENGIFKPIPVLIGNGELIAGLEEELEKMSEGEQRTITVEPGRAFGERKKELVVVVPLQEFRKRQVNPFPGLIVEINNSYGRVQTVSGGRVRVDMNSDLAGKTVEYSLKVEKLLKEPKEKAEVLADKFFPFKGKKVSIKLSGEELEVGMPSNLPKEVQVLKDAYASAVTESVKEIKKVKFVEEFVKEPKDGKKSEKEEAHEHSHDHPHHEGHEHSHDHDHAHSHSHKH